MSTNVLTIEAAKAANIVVSEEGSGKQAVHDVVVAMRANRRSGTANTKTRGERRGGRSRDEICINTSKINSYRNR